MFKRTNLIFCKFSDVNNNKIVFVTLKWLFVKNHLYKMINVIMIMQMLHFKNNTSKSRIQYYLRKWNKAFYNMKNL